MADHTHIEWTDATWNPITGCSIVSPGCTNCYAMRLAGTRLKHTPSRAGLTVDSKAGPVWTGEVRLNEQWLDQPLRWKRARKIFVCAHGDLFAEGVPDEWIDRVFAVMALAPQHTFQVLTKRAARMRQYLTGLETARRVYDIVCDSVIDGGVPAVLLAPGIEDPGLKPGWPRIHLGQWPLPNVWLGVSAEDQTRADDRVPELLATPAAIRFVSAEPLLGPIDFEVAWHGENALDSECWGDCAWCEKGYPALHNCQRGKGDWKKGRSGLDWIIVGGESGPGARPMHPDWVRSIRDQCASAGTAFFFKQWGAWAPRRQSKQSDLVDARKTLIVAPNGSVSSGLLAYPDTAWILDRSGKKAAGRLLDGIEHNAMPLARP